MSEPTLSVIIPAWNEEKWIGRTIESLKHAASVYERERGCTAEIIVVDNNSSDKTGNVARQHGVLVVHEPVNNIGKARNAGARAARGKYVAFCDADNAVTDNLLVLIHDHLEDPRIAGGGTWIEPANHNLKIDFFYLLWHMYVRCSRVGVGMMHCRKEDFEAFGGFDETIYAAEDVQLAYDLKKIGKPRGQKFNLIRKGWVITSTRKIDQTPLLTMFAKLVGFGFGLQRKIRSKEYCEHWYEKAAR
ncbi:MAG TPA: glycosyltransferase [Verrucomicrobiae bacterium]|nr:glycosyltransferase [Verrucomicrobiae bacterium]